MIRNFSIIAHIDHGKTTFTKRILEVCGGLYADKSNKTFLDISKIEEIKKITLRLKVVKVFFFSKNKKKYVLNLIDTPGHHDFNHEVQKSLTSSEGSVLLIDSSQGLKSQTVKFFYNTINTNNISILVLNKTDLLFSNCKKIIYNLNLFFSLLKFNLERISSLTGYGINNTIEKVVKVIPAPFYDSNNFLALIMSNYYNKHLGTLSIIRVIQGHSRIKTKIKTRYGYSIVKYLGVLLPIKIKVKFISNGDLGYISCLDKNVRYKDGDLIGYYNKYNANKVRGFLYCNVYTDKDYKTLKNITHSININDKNFFYKIVKSPLLGYGIKCSFSGLLHLRIVQELLSKKYHLKTFSTIPSIPYKIYLKSNTARILYNCCVLSKLVNIKFIKELWARIIIFFSKKNTHKLLNIIRTKYIQQEGCKQYLSKTVFSYLTPFSDIVLGFCENLTSSIKGYGSWEWTIRGYKKNDLVKLNIIINNISLELFSIIINRNKAINSAKKICTIIQNILTQKMFSMLVKIQLNNKTIASSTINARRGAVTEKCYGGDVTRKKKLLEKQVKGKHKIKCSNISLSKREVSGIIDSLKYAYH